MEKKNNELSQAKINAGRGVAKQRDTSSDSSTSTKDDQDDRLDERARKAGC